ncbi:MAG: SPOR domain-containing protein [Treponema sp.]|nr:SPOR domain-containing protein [Treponema sp.]
MEQKRTIWIALAAGVFLLVVIGAALLMYGPMARKDTTVASLKDNGAVWISPSANPEPVVDPYAQGYATLPAEDSSLAAVPETEQPTDDVSSFDLNSPTGANPLQTVAQTDNLTVIANGTTTVYGLTPTAPQPPVAPATTTIDLNTLKNNYVSSAVTAQNQAAENAMRETAATHKVIERETIVVLDKTAASAPDSSVNVAVVNMPDLESSTAPAKSYGGHFDSSTSALNKVVENLSSVSNVNSASRLADKFWVQAASFTSKRNADEARTVLDDNKIQCEVFTYTDAKGNLFYRVRVGPYTTKSEAEYWKGRIDSIALFSKTGSYVTNSSAPLVAKK